MYVAQDIQHVTSKYIPKTVTTPILQGMAINRDGTVHTSTAAGVGYLGLALSDLYPASTPAPNCACPADDRMMALATGGRLAIRVQNAVEYAAISPGNPITITNGLAASSGPQAKTINGDVIIADAKVVDGVGQGYVLVYMN